MFIGGIYLIENDIYEESNKFIVKKEIHGKWVTFGSFDNLDDAIELRDELEDYGWPYRDEYKIDEIEKYIFKENDKFLVSKKIIGQDIVFGIFDSLNNAKSFKRRLVQNAWNLNFYTRPSKYGRYIKRVGKRFGIFKNVNGEDINFGYFKSVDEAIMFRNELIDNNWNMGEDKILSNLGIMEFDLGIGLVGRKFIVFDWNESKCTIYGFYTSRRLANEAKEKLFNQNNLLDNKIDYSYEDTRYIHRVNNYYRITKVLNGIPKNFGHYKTLEEAICIRDELIQKDWDDSFLNLKRIARGEDSYNKHIHKSSRGYDVINRIDGYLYNFGSFESLEDAISFRDYLEENNWVISHEEDNDFEEEKYDEFIFLKNDGKYYLKNEIDGEMRIFGIFSNPLDAIATRLDCIKNNWDLSSVSEEEYLKNPNMNFEFGNLNDEIEEITDDMLGSNILDKTIDFPVTVGKSYKNGGWAIKRSYLDEFIPNIPFERECSIIVDGIKVIGKMNIHTRLFYFKDDILSSYLKNLHDIDPKAQTRVTFELNHGIYSFSKNDIGEIEFITKFSKSFKKGLFAVPRSISKNIIPILPYEQECNYLINGIKVIGKFNLEFRFRFSNVSFISKLESKFDENDELIVKLLL